MKTIVERAREYVLNDINTIPAQECECFIRRFRAYIAGATWQKAIDIEKACEWLKNNWREYVNQDRDGMILFGNWESDFRKAMEE